MQYLYIVRERCWPTLATIRIKCFNPYGIMQCLGNLSLCQCCIEPPLYILFPNRGQMVVLTTYSYDQLLPLLDTSSFGFIELQIPFSRMAISDFYCILIFKKCLASYISCGFP